MLKPVYVVSKIYQSVTENKKNEIFRKLIFHQNAWHLDNSDRTYRRTTFFRATFRRGALDRKDTSP